MPQIKFGPDEAHQAVDEFLAEAAESESPYQRWIAGADGKPLAYITGADMQDRLEEEAQAWRDHIEPRDDADLPPGYRPWQHSPLASTERLLPTEPLHEALARIFYGKGYDELPRRDYSGTVDEALKTGTERAKVEVAAIACLLRVTLDPDGQGAVPVLALNHEPDEPGNGMRWQLAFVTSVPGLYVRETANGLFGAEWGIVSGSGYRLTSGYLSRADCTAAVEALGRVLPNVDWMRVSPDTFTAPAMKAAAGVFRRYRSLGLDESVPEPAPVADALPAEAGLS